MALPEPFHPRDRSSVLAPLLNDKTRKDAMNYIVLDLEWNQCPAGKKYEDPKLPFEIIEIGAVKLSGDFQPLGSFHEIIRPEVYKRLHFMTRSVINLRERDLKGKRSFPEVFRDFSAWCGDDFLFCTWGPGDLPELQRNVAWHQRRNRLKKTWPFAYPLFYRDVQELFSITYEDGIKRRSLEWAVEYMNLEKKEKFHGAWSDALYTSRILEKIPQKTVEECVFLDTFKSPKTREEEILLQDGNTTRFFSMSFRDRELVMHDKVIAQTKCPVCGRRCRKKIRWFEENSKNLLCAAICPDHGLLKGRVRLRQNGEGLWFAIKTIQPIPEEDLDQIRNRQESAKRRMSLHPAMDQNGSVVIN